MTVPDWDACTCGHHHGAEPCRARGCRCGHKPLELGQRIGRAIIIAFCEPNGQLAIIEESEHTLKPRFTVPCWLLERAV